MPPAQAMKHPKRSEPLNARKLDDGALECRSARGHAMVVDYDVIPDPEYAPMPGCLGMYSSCVRECGRWRIQWILGDEIVGTSGGYDKPEYLNTGFGKFDRSKAIREWARRTRMHRKPGRHLSAVG